MNNKYNYENYRKRLLWDIRSRCLNQRVNNWRKIYFAKGIKCFLTHADIDYLWKRDKVYNLKRPSIDRIDSEGDYTLENCRFIELTENSRRAGVKNIGMGVIQKTLDDKIVTKHRCATDVQKQIGINQSNISKCCRGLRETAGNYRWEFIYD